MENFEKLGVFYLGKKHNLQTGQTENDLILYDSKDLTTHAVCIGMTGSGKTGLGIYLIEEAAIDGIPSLIIDPKGDMTNLLLTFPELQPDDFLSWINPDEARKKNLSPGDFAAKQADLWKNGLAQWGEDGDHIRRLKNSAEFTIYTPGSTMRSAGRTAKEASDVARAKARLELLQQQLQELQDKFQNKVESHSAKFDLSLEEIKTVDIHPQKTNISVEFVGLVWVPQWITEKNGTAAAF